MQRLKTRSQFQAVLAGDAVARTAHFVMHRARLDVMAVDQCLVETAAPSVLASALPRGASIGAMVPKRLAKRAVMRNTIKRQIFCACANAESTLPAAAHVVRMRSGFDKNHFVSASSEKLKLALRDELRQLFAKSMPLASVSQQGGGA